MMNAAFGSIAAAVRISRSFPASIGTMRILQPSHALLMMAAAISVKPILAEAFGLLVRLAAPLVPRGKRGTMMSAAFGWTVAAALNSPCGFATGTTGIAITTMILTGIISQYSVGLKPGISIGLPVVRRKLGAPKTRAGREKFNTDTHALFRRIAQGNNSTYLLFSGDKIGEDNIGADFH